MTARYLRCVSGNACSRNTDARSDVENTPPLSSTALDGQIAVAFDCVCAGLSTVANWIE